jgi:CspA family cold shock protein
VPEGKVKFFDTAKCFGYLITDDQEEIYVHAGDLIDLIRKNQRVAFEIEEDSGQKSAVNVRVIKAKNR